MPIPPQAFRGVVFEALRRDFGTQWLSFQQQVASVAAEREFAPTPTTNRPARLEVIDADRLRAFFWQLVAQGVLTVGYNDSNAAWPFMALTEFGRIVVAEPDVSYLPYDHLGYIALLRRNDPTVSEVVVQAVGEATECFFRGTHWAATIMLGVASEATIRELLEASTEAIQTESSRTKFRNDTSTLSIARAFKRLESHLASLSGDLPPDLRDGIDTTLVGVFGLIRLSRNDAGHPKIVPDADAASVHAKLILFLEYAKYVGSIKEWLRNNPHP